MRSLTRFLFFVLAGAGPATSFAQTPAPAPAATPTAKGDSLTAAASEEYRRGAFGRFFFGKHYRPTWQMPVTVPTFRPDQLGLKPVKEGGAMQTLNLRLVDKEGHQYVIRSVDKDLARALPEKQRGSAKARMLQDQTAAVHPYGALLAAELAEAARVYHATPKLYRVPTNEDVLGEFQKEFAGRMVYLEERPSGDWTYTAKFGGAPEVVSSEEMLRDRYAEGYHLPDARAYLRARLLDIMLGDWSRREDQWRWARHAVKGHLQSTYQPVPRDRDHAFSRYSDGFFPAVAVLFKPQVVTFGPNIGNIKRYVRTSETLDRMALAWLDADAYKAEADSLTRLLSDAAIDRALTRWPINVQRLEGKKFREMLISRRKQLPAAAQKLYLYLAKDVVLPGTDSTDTFTLSPGAGGVTITWLTEGRPKPSSVETRDKPESRTFKTAETRHLRLYGLGHADKLIINAALPKDGPKLEFYDGAGLDEAKRADGAETPTWLRVVESGDENRFDGLPEWARQKDKNVSARDYDAAGFLLRHRLE